MVVNFSKNIRELNILDFRKTLGDLRKFGKKFVSKNCQTRYNSDWIKFSCYKGDKRFRKSGEVNIWRGKSEVILQKNLLIKTLLHFCTLFYVTNSSAEFHADYTYFFKQLGSVLSHQICLYFKVFRAQSFLMVA